MREIVKREESLLIYCVINVNYRHETVLRMNCRICNWIFCNLYIVVL